MAFKTALYLFNIWLNDNLARLLVDSGYTEVDPQINRVNFPLELSDGSEEIDRRGKMQLTLLRDDKREISPNEIYDYIIKENNKSNICYRLANIREFLSIGWNLSVEEIKILGGLSVKSIVNIGYEWDKKNLCISVDHNSNTKKLILVPSDRKLSSDCCAAIIGKYKDLNPDVQL